MAACRAPQAAERRSVRWHTLRVAFAIILIGGPLLGCFSVRLPPELPPNDPPKSNLTVGVQVPSVSADLASINEYVADEIAQELFDTGLFAEAYRLTAHSPTPDLIVEIVKLERVDPSSWCTESYAYTAFTAFVVPGCALSLGYKLAFRGSQPTPVDFEYKYSAFHLSGWVALFTLPFPNWSLPRADATRRLQYLRAQLAPVMPQIAALAANAT